MNATQITELLRHRHPEPEWATFAELADGTGVRFGGRMDFFAMNLWPSKRYLKIAYEIKISRSDFMRELNNPRKRLSAEKNADECYFVAPAGLLSPDEMPDGWGLLECNLGGLRIRKRARQKEVVELPLDFVAALLRRASDPPSILPEIFWRYAGKELNQEQLLQAAQNNLISYAERKKSEGVREFKESKDFKRLELLEKIIEEEVGWRFTLEPESLHSWFDDNKKKGVDSKLLNNLRQLKTSLDAILGE